MRKLSHDDSMLMFSASSIFSKGLFMRSFYFMESNIFVLDVLRQLGPTQVSDLSFLTLPKISAARTRIYIC